MQSIVVATRIPKTMQKTIETALRNSGHLNTADYIRNLLRKDLERQGLLPEATQ